MHQGKIGLAFVPESAYQAYFDIPEGRSCCMQILSQFCVFSIREWVRVTDRGEYRKFKPHSVNVDRPDVNKGDSRSGMDLYNIDDLTRKRPFRCSILKP